jgi:hypothetical protein
MKGDIMNKPNIKNSFFWILMFVILAGPAHDVFAQRTRVSTDRRSSETKVTHKSVEKKKEDRQKKDVRRNSKQNVKKNNQRKNTGKNMASRFHENRTYKKRPEPAKLKNKSYHKKSYSNMHYHKPSWVDHYKRYHHFHKIGTRFNFLPHGYITFRIGNFRFFAYQGTYYRYDPVYRNYIVIEKPVIESNYTSSQWDRITLNDGSTIEGIYISGDSEKVVFEVGDALLEIPQSEIQLLTFSQK